MRLLVTVHDGFIGKNCGSPADAGRGDVFRYTRASTAASSRAPRLRPTSSSISRASTRPPDASEYAPGNIGPARALCDALAAAGNKAPIVVDASSRRSDGSPYGNEQARSRAGFHRASHRARRAARDFRLPNVFGKWSRPNYNSVVATFCHNIARDLPINVTDRATPLKTAATLTMS